MEQILTACSQHGRSRNPALRRSTERAVTNLPREFVPSRDLGAGGCQKSKVKSQDVGREKDEPNRRPECDEVKRTNPGCFPCPSKETSTRAGASPDGSTRNSRVCGPKGVRVQNLRKVPILGLLRRQYPGCLSLWPLVRRNRAAALPVGAQRSIPGKSLRVPCCTVKTRR